MFASIGGSMELWRQTSQPAQTAATRGEPVSRTAMARDGGSAARPAAAEAARGNVVGKLPYGPSELPHIPNGYGPEELAARTRLRFPDPDAQAARSGEMPADWTPGAAKRGLIPGKDGEEPERESLTGEPEDEAVAGASEASSAADEAEKGKCETCEKRRYQDGSDDPGVSFKNPTRVDPRLAQAAVRGHEMEHVVRERAKAQQEGRRVVSQSVTYHTGICPECGKMYISGGTTRTVTAADNTSNAIESLTDGEDRLGATA